MTDRGVRARLSVDGRDACPVAAVSDEPGTTVDDIAWSSPTPDGGVVEEFTAETADGTGPPAGEFERVFGDDDAGRYRFERDRDGCICETVESFDCPVTDVHAEDGRLRLTFHAASVERVKAIVARLHDEYGDVSLEQLHAGGETSLTDTTVVDRSRLTDRQQEVVRTARELGYFEYPKGANASEVAEALDISVSTFAEHLAAAETKLLDDVFEE